jgi:hypothetical protein
MGKKERKERICRAFFGNEQKQLARIALIRNILLKNLMQVLKALLCGDQEPLVGTAS